MFGPIDCLKITILTLCGSPVIPVSQIKDHNMGWLKAGAVIEELFSLYLRFERKFS